MCSKNKKALRILRAFFCDLAGARTQDPHIKSVMLYLLSYQVDRTIAFNCECKNSTFLNTCNKNFQKISIQNSFALTGYKYLIFSAIHNRTLLIVAHAAINDDVNTVFITLVYLLRIGQKS